MKVYQVLFATNENDNWSCKTLKLYKNKDEAVAFVYYLLISYDELYNFLKLDKKELKELDKQNDGLKYDICPLTENELDKWCRKYANVALHADGAYGCYTPNICSDRYKQGWGWSIVEHELC